MADLSIYRMLPQAPQPQPVMTPYQYAAGANAIAEQQQQQELNRERMAQNAVTLRSTTQEADEYARKTAEHNQIVDVLRKHGGDLEKATPEIMQINPAVGQQFAEHNAKRASENFDYQLKRAGVLAGDAAELYAEKDLAKREAMRKIKTEQRVGSKMFTREELPQGPVDDAALLGYMDQHQKALIEDKKQREAEEQRRVAAEARAEQLSKLQAEQGAREAETYEATKPDASGLTPVQRETVRHQKALEEYQKTHWDAYSEYMGARTLGGVGGGQTANSRAVDRRKAETDLKKIEDSEAKLNDLRSQLGNALTTGKVYIDRFGNSKPIDTASGGDEDTKKSLIEGMRKRYSTATNQLKTHIKNKNAILDSLGRKVGVSTEDAIAALDGGGEAADEEGDTEQQAAPPAAAPAVVPRAPVPGMIGAQVRPGSIGAIGTPAAAMATPPPPNVLVKIPEGRSFVGPDGSKWKKVNGKAVLQ
jgi:hypothetical protein